jgi:hypothetical protein
MPTFQNNIMYLIAAVSAVSFAVWYYVFTRERFAIETRKYVAVFFLAWLAYYTLEYWIFGPYSFVSMDSEGNLAIAMDYALARTHGGGTFSHAFGGGQDMYFWFLGKQYFQPEVLLLKVFPVWLVILFHKALIAGLAFWGSYLLARKIGKASRFAAVATAVVFPVSHAYLTGFSTSFGTGFAALPFIVYTCTAGTYRKNFLSLTLFAGLLAVAADPVKVFPAMLVAVVGGYILHPETHFKKAAGVIVFLVLLSLLNWHEIIYALTQGMGFAERGAGHVTQKHDPLEALLITFNTLRQYWIPSALFAASLAVLLRFRDRFAARTLLMAAWMIAAMTGADAFPWSWLGVPAFDRLSHQGYMVLAFGVLATPVVARAVTVVALAANTMPATRYAPAAVLAFGLAMLTYDKQFNFGSLLWFGGQSDYFGYESLKSPRWNPDRSYRSVTLFEKPHSNIVAAFYGFDTFDGQMNLSYLNWAKYWVDVVRGNPRHGLGTRVGVDWQFWNGSTYEVDNHIRLDLLALANVRYLFSALPLQSDGLMLLNDPGREQWARVRPDFFAGIKDFIVYRAKRIFDPGELYIYELRTPLPRVFAASSVMAAPYYSEFSKLHALVAKETPKRTAVIRDTDAVALGAAGDLSIRDFAKVTDGYDITLESPHDGGVVVVNNFYSPFWKAWAGSRALTLVPANGIHMAISVPPGTRSLKVRYSRPLLRDKILSLSDR